MPRSSQLPSVPLRVGFLTLTCVALLLPPQVSFAAESDRPNILIIFTDDQGYGDLGCFGAESFRTPRIDSLAKEGTRFTSFYAQTVCGPSRSALLTGRYPVRSLGWSMPADEITVAEVLRDVGYQTACIGKWDVSNRAAVLDRMPNAQGFDYYFGTLGANDSGQVTFHENNEEAGSTDDMASLTRRYTDKAIEFLRQARKEQPFFLYLAHTMVHSVIDASPPFKGKSSGGLYGDTIEELDHEVGRLLDSLDDLGLRDNTLVVFTSDNGPWSNASEALGKKHDGQIAWGSSGPLRSAKGSTYEGGVRVPCVVRWPGHVPADSTSNAIFSTLDFLPTFAHLAGGTVPADRLIDGVDQTSLLLGKSQNGARDDFFYFCQGELHAVRKGNWKLMLPQRQRFYGYVKDRGTKEVELYDLADDLAESTDVAAAHPDVVAELMKHSSAAVFPDTAYGHRITSRVGRAETTPLPQGDWETHGLSGEQRERIRSAFQHGIDQEFIPGGSLMLIHRGEVVLKEGFGVADLASGTPFTESAPCFIASLTKPHTATLMAILADRGLVSLDEPIDRYLPEFHGLRVAGKGTAVAAPTLRQCLSHTTGFPSNDQLKSGRYTINFDGTLAEAVSDLAHRELLAEPGASYGYSRLGYMAAGRVAEVVTGRPFNYLMRIMLLDEIGAERAAFSSDAPTIASVPTPYERKEGGFRVRQGEPLGTVINPGGGLVATLDDVAQLMLLHRNGGKVGNRQVVSAAILREMLVPQPGTPGTGYGLGFNIMRKASDGTPLQVRHTGASGTLAMLDFERDLIAIVFTQVPQQQTLRWRSRLMETILETFLTNPAPKR